MLYSPIFFQSNTKNIEDYTILGERHSGTNWLERIVCSRLNLPITWRFGSKHFIDSLDPNLMALSNKTLFICITRNIYDWIGGFFKLPHHVDKSICYDINKFLCSEWHNDFLDKNYFTGKPYKNIFDLRSNKLFFYLFFLPYIVDNIIIIKYEDLMVNPENVVSFISDQFSISKTTKTYSRLTIPRKKPCYKFSKKVLQIIDEKTDWSMEYYYRYYLACRL
jgi:hypothetical protein